MKFTLLSMISLVAMAMTLFTTVDAMDVGAPWAADSRWAPRITGNKHLNKYQHWEMRNVKELSRAGLEYVPSYWGDKKAHNWPATKRAFKRYRYKHLLCLNEPDVPSQAGYSPARAANAFQSICAPMRRYGTKISSPQICYDLKWLESFTRILKKRGGHYDFVALHYYGSWNSLSKFKKYISQAHRQFGKDIWITEIGVTSASHPSTGQAKKFFIDATNWAASTGYVKAIFPFIMFAKPPDSFASSQNAGFNHNGQLRSVAKWFRYYSVGKRSLDGEHIVSRDITRRHHALLKRIEEDNTDEELWDDQTQTAEPEHCDGRCKQIDEYLEKAKPFDIDAADEHEIEAAKIEEPEKDAFTEEDHLAPHDEDDDEEF